MNRDNFNGGVLEKKFKNMLHQSFKNKVDYYIENYNTEKEKVTFMYDMEDIFTCGKGMVQSLVWYLSDNTKNFKKAKKSTDVYDRFLSFLDQQTGTRTVKDYSKETHPLFTKFYPLLESR